MSSVSGVGSFAPPGLVEFFAPHHSLRCGLHSLAASRLGVVLLFERVSWEIPLCCWIVDALYWIHPAGRPGLPNHHTEGLGT